MAARGDEDVGGLDVAVDDAFGMGGVAGVGNLDSAVEKKIQLEWTAGNALAKRLAFEELHSDEGASFVLIDFVDGADVGMIERRGGAGFALEALEGLTVGGESVGEEFQGDVAPRRRSSAS